MRFLLVLTLAAALLGCASSAPLARAVAVSPGPEAAVTASRDAGSPVVAQAVVPTPSPSITPSPSTFPVPQDGHRGSVNASVWSPSGEFLATGGFDQTIRLWDRDGQLWIVLRGHRASIRRVLFSPDGERLASSSRDGTVRLWNLRTGQTLFVLEGAGWDVAWSPDGSTLATVGPGPRSDSAIRLWRAEDGAFLAEVEAGLPAVRQLLSVGFASDGATIAAAGNGHLVFIDTRSLSVVAHAAGPGNFVAAPHEPTFWAGSDDGRLTVIDPRTGATLRTIRTIGAQTLHHLAFSRDGRWLAAAGAYERTAIIHAASGRVRTRFRHARFVETLAFNPQDDLLAVAGGDTPQILTYDAPSGRRRRRFGDASRAVNHVAFSPDGIRLATAGDDHAEIWDLRTGALLGGQEVGRRPRGRLDQTMTSVAWSPDAALLAVGGGAERTRILDGQTGAIIAQIRFANPQDAVMSFAWDGPSENLAIACAQELVRWERASGAVTRATLPLPLRDPIVTDASRSRIALNLGSRVSILDLPGLNPIFDLASASLGARFQLSRIGISGDGRTIVAVGDMGTLAIAGQGIAPRRTPSREVWAMTPLVFSPDGRLAYGTPDHAVRVLRGESRTTVGQHDAWIRSLAWMADGSLASGSDDGRVRIWDPETGELTREYGIHEQRVWHIDAHPLLPVIASAGNYVHVGTRARSIGLRIYRHDGTAMGLFFDDHGVVGGDPQALQRFMRIRSGPGILDTTLVDVEAGRSDPLPSIGLPRGT